jgi:hypothetical protein
MNSGVRLAIALFLIAGCTSEQPASDSTRSAPDAQTPASQPLAAQAYGDTVEITALYATSTNLPSAKSGPANLFDGTTAAWETMPGADRMEGVMLYFTPKADFDELELIPAAGANALTVSRLRVITDGWERGVVTAGSRFRLVDDYCEDDCGHASYYLKIDSLAGGRSDGSRPAAVAELRFYRKGVPVLVVPPRSAVAKVTASSSLEPAEAYSAAFLFDGRRDFGWAEGSRGTGVGESLTFTFPSRVVITALRIWNGYQRSPTHFRANARVRSFSLTADDHPATQYRVADANGPTEVRLQLPLGGQQLRLRVDEVYPGGSYPDLVISELQFFDGTHWFGIDDGKGDERKRALIARAKGTPIERLLDRAVSGANGTSLTLRSNGSFAVWVQNPDSVARSNTDSTSPGYLGQSLSNASVADGNWRILSTQDSTVHIEIFGRIHSLSEIFDLYGGRDTNSSVRRSFRGRETTLARIFQDELTVDRRGVAARKIFGRIDYR